MKEKTKSPLKAKPLRYPAQSADEAIEDFLDDKIFIYYFTIVLFGIGVAYEWWKYFHPTTHPPYLLTIIFFITSVFCSYKLVKHIKVLRHLKQGRSGERAVGQFLESMRSTGCHVYHDIVGQGFNIDHVVISTKGIFVIETKTYSKPAKGEPIIYFDGKKVLINGKPSKTDIVPQVKAGSSHIKKVLNASTGRNFDTFPVVLFPGWCIKGDGNRKGEMFVMEPKAFKKYVEYMPPKLSKEDASMASYHLSRHIRNL